MARRNAASDQPPMPVSRSGEMLVEKMVPKGVGTGSPPAKSLPSRTVWQVLQLPITARCRPCLTRSGRKDCLDGDATVAIDGRHANAAPAATTSSGADSPATSFQRVMRLATSRFLRNTLAALSLLLCRHSPAVDLLTLTSGEHVPVLNVPFAIPVQELAGGVTETFGGVQSDHHARDGQPHRDGRRPRAWFRACI